MCITPALSLSCYAECCWELCYYVYNRICEKSTPGGVEKKEKEKWEEAKDLFEKRVLERVEKMCYLNP